MTRRPIATALALLAALAALAWTAPDAGAQTLDLAGDLCGASSVGPGTTVTVEGVASGLAPLAVVGASTLLAFDDFSRIEPLGQAGDAATNITYAFGGSVQSVVAEFEGVAYASYAGATAGAGVTPTDDFALFTFMMRIAEDAPEGTISFAPTNALGAGNTVALAGGANVALAAGAGCEITVTHCTTDLDGDGFGAPGDASCPGGARTDCDDADAAVFPGAREVIANGVDDDCSPRTPDVVETDTEATVVLGDVIFEEPEADGQDCGYIVQLLLDLAGFGAL